MIRESKYNIHYRNIAKEKVTKILRREDEVEGQKNTDKIQMWKRNQSKGILERRGRKKCRLCRRKEEDLRHVIGECEIMEGPKDIGKMLNEAGEGLTELKAIVEKSRANDRKDSLVVNL
ncbi:uncharacterized protein LOC112212060 [Bombus impatiens]|uniref:Uncharacterized protein LOC112212060 n=1 Tax=Bombus impatiens TaxID=132113 RepID=A0A6P6F665_BOMIM|nr:uncharacterized protein LOC112212060 [Bombus impatiens]XP_033174506.1 uncharacterized protein LOC112212060 [Bombus impatiens]